MVQPTLRYGARGEAVALLQNALNAWAPAHIPSLEPDGVFGMKTAGTVRNFQSASKLQGDGIVGPLTWEKLKPFVEALAKQITKPGSETAAVERIIAVAESALATFGFSGPVVLDPASPRIAAAKCADPANPLRPRQGGMSLASVFQLAGAPMSYANRCPTISIEAEAKWQEQATAWRNAHDLPAWCGIFCYYVYRVSGIQLNGGWSDHKRNIWTDKLFTVIGQPAQAPRGAIGVLDGVRSGGRNHHFIVTANDPGGALIRSIDGNAHGPDQNTFVTNWSTVARREYTHTFLKSQDAYFLYPDFTKQPGG